MLSLFFAAVALLLAGVGLYGVLDYSVAQRRREIGIRLALGAQADEIVRRVTAEVFSMLILGAVVGLGMGIASESYVDALLYQVKTTDFTNAGAAGGHDPGGSHARGIATGYSSRADRSGGDASS